MPSRRRRPRLHCIYLLAAVSWVAITPKKSGSSSTDPAVSLHFPSRIEKNLSVHSWCKGHFGKKKFTNVAMAWTPSPLSPPFFLRSWRTLFQDYTDQGVRMALGNEVTITHSYKIAYRFYNNERTFMASSFTRKGHFPSIRGFGDFSPTLKILHASPPVQLDRVPF